MTDRRIVVVNQAVNYLTVGLCNEFVARFSQVSLVTGNVHSQGEELSDLVDVRAICKWREQHGLGKAVLYVRALLQIYFLLLIRYRPALLFAVPKALSRSSPLAVNRDRSSGER